MTQNKKEVPTPNPSVDADGGQTLRYNNTLSLPEKCEDDNGKCEEDWVWKQKMRQHERMTNPNYLHTVTMNELYETTYDLKAPIIQGLLYAGAYLFAGAPKVGKSFFMAQLAYHVSTGQSLWDYPVRQSDVLYLALEDDYGRLQRRLAKMFDVETTDRLHFAIAAKQLGDGLEGQMKEFLREYPSTRLVIIDTLQKVRESGADGYSYGNDYDLVGSLKRFADEHGICLLMVHHTRKQKATDNFDMVSGTNGLTGAADGTFIMQKTKRTDTTATLEVCGRDQQDQKLTLARDTQRLSWNLESVEGEAFEETPEPILDAVATLLTAGQPQWQGTATELVAALGLDIKPNKVTMKLNVNSGRLLNDYGIIYKNNHTRTKRTISFQLEIVVV